MKREIIITADGSSTIHIPEWDEQYHSKHGAIQEAYHVFIKHGLHHFISFEGVSESYKTVSEVSILEIGFGTGLNTFITLLETEKLKSNIDYTGVEGYPVLQLADSVLFEGGLPRSLLSKMGDGNHIFSLGPRQVDVFMLNGSAA